MFVSHSVVWPLLAATDTRTQFYIRLRCHQSVNILTCKPRLTRGVVSCLLPCQVVSDRNGPPQRHQLSLNAH